MPRAKGTPINQALADNSVVGATGQLSRIDEQRMQQQVGADLRYDTFEYTEPVRKAGLDVDKVGLSDKDVKTIKAAQTLIREHLAEAGGMAVVATGAGILANCFAVDGNSQDNIQDAAVASGLLGLGGYSGYAAGANTYSPMSEALAVRRQEAGDTTPIQGRVFARDSKRRNSRGRTGAVVGAGALLGLIKAYEQDEQLRRTLE